jgi:hypothetical protein
MLQGVKVIGACGVAGLRHTNAFPQRIDDQSEVSYHPPVSNLIVNKRVSVVLVIATRVASAQWGEEWVNVVTG